MLLRIQTCLGLQLTVSVHLFIHRLKYQAVASCQTTSCSFPPHQAVLLPMSTSTMTEQLQATVYHPLEDSEIRLVSFSISSADGKVECRLISARLDDVARDSFAALSYVWGDPTDTVLIRLNGAEFPITRNLYHALLNIKSHHPRWSTRVKDIAEWELGAPVWWIDALCINQSDLNEISLQIVRMKKIFSSASAVVVWLGHWPGVAGEIATETVETARRCAKLLLKERNAHGSHQLDARAAVQVTSKAVDDPGEILSIT